LKTKIVLIGGFVEIIELLEENNISITGIVDNKQDRLSKHDYLGNDDEFLTKIIYRDCHLVLTPDVPKIRELLFEKYKDYSFYTLVSKDAKISPSSIINDGSIIQFRVNVSSRCKIGKFCKLNTYSNIMHDVNIGNFTTVAPNAVVLGNVVIGNKCYIGANATILPNISICNDVVIGAGSVVTKNITISGKYSGTPARIML